MKFLHKVWKSKLILITSFIWWHFLVEKVLNNCIASAQQLILNSNIQINDENEEKDSFAQFKRNENHQKSHTSNF